MKQILLAALVIFSLNANAGPFNQCPSNAFLVQGDPAGILGVNLATGSIDSLAPDLGTGDTVNAVGFSVHDNYLYGWDYATSSLVRIHSDFTVEQLPVTGLPAQPSFFVGDVSVDENAMYLYRDKAGWGLYKIPLDSTAGDYLQATKVIDQAVINTNYYDMAFHPDDGKLYAIKQTGNLHQIDLVAGTKTNLGTTKQSGAFGALYFDVDGNLYMSRNSDGHIFLVDIDTPANTSFYTFGPSSTDNDGARCANAPIIDINEDPTIDYGDAPDSYGTTLNSNGARHDIDDLLLGSTVDAEHTPNADDNDDGVSFVTGFEIGLDTVVSFTSSKPGYLNAWIDWNQNGIFNNNEQIISSYLTNGSTEQIVIPVPSTATVGNTWARFRISTEADLGATGGVPGGEVEDYSLPIIDPGVTQLLSVVQTVAFEDLWPDQGDYDFNDVVVKYQIVQSDVAGQTVKFDISGTLQAVGASYHNGFAFHFPDISRTDVNEARIYYTINGALQSGSPLEAGRTKAILIPFADTKAIAPTTDGCTYFRTEAGCEGASPVSFHVTLPISGNYPTANTSMDNIEPFIFAVNGFAHGAHVDTANARAWEVHLKNNNPTEAFNTSYFDLGDDSSTASGNYQTSTGLPWGLKMPTNWAHPTEKTDMLEGYPSFKGYAESNGASNTTWFNSPAGDKTVSND